MFTSVSGVQDQALSDLVDRGYIYVLPDRDRHGRRVIFSQAAAFDPSKYSTSDMMRAHVMTFETLLSDEENQVVYKILNIMDLGMTDIFSPRYVGLPTSLMRPG